MFTKKLIYISIMVIQITFSHISFSQDYYEKGIYRLRRSNYQHGLVSGFDHILMASLHLPDYTVSGSGPLNILWYTGITYHFAKNKNDKGLIFTIGVYPTVMEAEETILDCLNNSQLILFEGSAENIIIGDNSWYAKYSGWESIKFVRKNVIVAVSCIPLYYPDLLKLAESIDKDLVNGAPFVSLSDIVNPPVIQSITVSSQTLKEGEEALITMTASDPSNSNLLYRFHPNAGSGSGWRKFTDPENVYRITPTREFFTEPIITIKAWVVNERNVFSSISEIKINF